MKEVSRDAQLNGVYYANEGIKVDGDRYPLNYAFYEVEDIWETNVRGTKAWVVGIRYAINANDIDGYIVAVEEPDGRACIATYDKERLAELNGSKQPSWTPPKTHYTAPSEVHLTKTERRRQRRENARKRKQ